MELAHHLILVGAFLVMLSILAGLVSSRLGAPLLLVFLGLGMLAGQDGPGGIRFDNFGAAYLLGSLALAVILFDGGLRTTPRNFAVAWKPALTLATAGVVLTAALVGAVAAWLLDLHWLQGMLVGSMIAPTDAAAVFLLLHGRGLRLRENVSSALEVESGFNDPMSIFLTLLGVSLLQAGALDISWATAGHVVELFLRQLVGGAILGFIGGRLLLWLINRLDIDSGLYPILALSSALLLFAFAQSIDSSGFMAIYLVGFFISQRRHRATLLISRFSDGISWLAQIMMFLMLGLLVTPTALLPQLGAALAISLFLMFVARPVAVWLCLKPFGFAPREIAFVSWVGLRGAVPIFLATIPVLAGVDHGFIFFSVAYVVVLTSLAVQGWTVAAAARRLGLELPPHPEAPVRAELDLPGTSDQVMAAYTVKPFSMAARRRLDRLRLADGMKIVSVVRDGVPRPTEGIARLAPNDYVLVIAPSEKIGTLDRLFAPGVQQSGRSHREEMIGEFVLEGAANLGQVADLYEFSVPRTLRRLTVARFLRLALGRGARPGTRLHVGGIDLAVRAIEEGRIVKVGLDADPPPSNRRPLHGLRIWWLAVVDALRQTVPARFRKE